MTTPPPEWQTGQPIFIRFEGQVYPVDDIIGAAFRAGPIWFTWQTNDKRVEWSIDKEHWKQFNYEEAD